MITFNVELSNQLKISASLKALHFKKLCKIAQIEISFSLLKGVFVGNQARG